LHGVSRTERRGEERRAAVQRQTDGQGTAERTKKAEAGRGKKDERMTHGAKRREDRRETGV
jgi:hypothetical protein